MLLAMKEAIRALGRTSPNPAVGAVLVKNDQILSKGYHRSAGLPHAEIEALRKLSPSKAIGATLYVTLEPCSSHGKTPPCTEAILAAGISRVVYGATDPDKRHRGRASRILSKAGIVVRDGVLDMECSAINAHWNHCASTGLPWVIAKAALTLDGCIDSHPQSRWISSEESRKEAMRLRTNVEAILVGGGTVRSDDPSLTIRDIRISKNHPQPWRIIWSKSGKIPRKSKLLMDTHRDRTLLFGGITLRKVLQELGKRGISCVLIEGGGYTLGESFKRKLVDEVRFFIAPVIQGGKIPAVKAHISPAHLTDLTYTKIGSDVMISGLVKKG